MDANIVKHAPKVICVFGKLGAGKSTLIEKLLPDQRLQISSAATTAHTLAVSDYWTTDKKFVFIDAPGYGDPEQQVDLQTFEKVSNHLSGKPYISNVIIMIEMPKRFDQDMFNCVKTYWELINKNQDIKILIILTGRNVLAEPFEELERKFRDFVSKYKQNNYFKLINLKFNMMFVPDPTQYDKDLILKLVSAGSLNFTLEKLITYSADHFVKNYSDEASMLQGEIDTAKSQYLQTYHRPFDDVNYTSPFQYYTLGETYEDYIKSRYRRLELLSSRILRIKQSKIQFLVDLGRCHGITKARLRCKNTKRCTHHPNDNKNK